MLEYWDTRPPWNKEPRGRPKNTFGTTETQSTSRTLESFRV